MAGRAEFYRNVAQFGGVIRKAVNGKAGSAAKEKQLRILLLRMLEIGEMDPLLRRAAKRVWRGRTLLAKLAERVEENGYGIPKAVYDHVHWKTGLKTACTRWDCTPSEIVAIRQVAESVGRELGSFTKEMEPFDVGCIDEVEALHEEIEVYLSPHALEDMLVASLEGYLVPKTRRLRFTEVYGLCLGTIRDQLMPHGRWGRHRIRHIYVQRATVHLRARGTRDSVVPNPKSFKAHFAAARALFPHLEVIGDFHSHPYRDIHSLRRAEGWMFSDQDSKYVRKWLEDMRAEDYEPTVDFIVAIGKRKKSGGARSGYALSDNVDVVEIDRNQIAIGAHRILRNGRYESEGITLHVPKIIGG